MISVKKLPQYKSRTNGGLCYAETWADKVTIYTAHGLAFRWAEVDRVEFDRQWEPNLYYVVGWESLETGIWGLEITSERPSVFEFVGSLEQCSTYTHKNQY
jgi:hypothetical protein